MKGPKRDDVMTEAEIRWWLRELLDRHGWGPRCLRRTLGLTDRGSGNIVRHKADGRSWIYPREKTRMSLQLKRIISGELVVQNVKPWSRGFIQRAVIADDPQPLRGGWQWNINLARGTASLSTQRPHPTPLPNFRTLLENPRRYTLPGLK